MRQALKPALVLIDLQKDLCYDDRRRGVYLDAVENIRRLIDAFVDHNLPVIFTRFELDPNDEQFGRFGDAYCIRGTPGAEFVDEIDPHVGVVITKVKHSAFFGTDLESVLRGCDANTVILGGLQTQICVLTTAADAYNRGFNVIAAQEVVMSTREEVKLDALEWISKYVGEVQTVDEILALL